MTRIDFSRQVPFTAEQMLELVADVNSYPDFVPNCENMIVRGLDDASPEECEATMAVRFGPISGEYTSKVRIDRQSKTIVAEAIDGPFAHLDSMWTFTPAGEGSAIRFDIDFAFSNRLIAAVAEPLFADKQEEIIDAFVARAQSIYASD